MILRPLNSAEPGDPVEPGLPETSDGSFTPAWTAVERIQRRRYESCWMITQPSHAALAGALAARMEIPLLRGLDSGILEAIALHDAGWGALDAQAIEQSRSSRPGAGAVFQPTSFLDAPLPGYLSAWIKSIETAQSVSPAGGYIVSRHFYRLAEHRVQSGHDAQPDRKKLEAFVTEEARRQQRLKSRQPLEAQDLERLTDLLQLCDLLSLYICAGAKEHVVFPEWLGMRLRATRQAEGLRLDPRLIPGGASFPVAALRYPPDSHRSGQEITVRVR